MVSDPRSSRKKLESDDRQHWVVESRVIDNVFSESKNCVEIHQTDTRTDDDSCKHEWKSCLQCRVNRINVDRRKRGGCLYRMVETVEVAPEKRDLMLDSMSPVPCGVVCARDAGV